MRKLFFSQIGWFWGLFCSPVSPDSNHIIFHLVVCFVPEIWLSKVVESAVSIFDPKLCFLKSIEVFTVHIGYNLAQSISIVIWTCWIWKSKLESRMLDFRPPKQANPRWLPCNETYHFDVPITQIQYTWQLKCLGKSCSSCYIMYCFVQI